MSTDPRPRRRLGWTANGTGIRIGPQAPTMASRTSAPTARDGGEAVHGRANPLRQQHAPARRGILHRRLRVDVPRETSAPWPTGRRVEWGYALGSPCGAARRRPCRDFAAPGFPINRPAVAVLPTLPVPPAVPTGRALTDHRTKLPAVRANGRARTRPRTPHFDHDPNPLPRHVGVGRDLPRPGHPRDPDQSAGDRIHRVRRRHGGQRQRRRRPAWRASPLLGAGRRRLAGGSNRGRPGAGRCRRFGGPATCRTACRRQPRS